jgi:hypothetical protein
MIYNDFYDMYKDDIAKGEVSQKCMKDFLTVMEEDLNPSELSFAMNSINSLIIKLVYFITNNTYQTDEQIREVARAHSLASTVVDDEWYDNLIKESVTPDKIKEKFMDAFKGVSGLRNTLGYQSHSCDELGDEWFDYKYLIKNSRDLMIMYARTNEAKFYLNITENPVPMYEDKIKECESLIKEYKIYIEEYNRNTKEGRT